MANVVRGEPVFEDTPVTVLGRLCAKTASGSASPITQEGSLVVQGDVTSISVKAYDETATLIVTTTPAASDVLFNTIQTTGLFSNLKRGGNFLYQLPATMFPTGSTNVRIEMTFTLTSGELVRSLWDFPVINLNQS